MENTTQTKFDKQSMDEISGIIGGITSLLDWDMFKQAVRRVTRFNGDHVIKIEFEGGAYVERGFLLTKETTTSCWHVFTGQSGGIPDKTVSF